MTKAATAMLTMVGVSHHEAPLEVRERLAVPADRIDDALAALTARLGPAAILATCNRTEVYLSGDAPHEAVFAILEATAGFDAQLARQYARVRTGLDVVRHLFEVSAGIDSMVLGEPEILGQVRAAYYQATSAGSDDALLGKLFHLAIRVGRRARAETGISRRAVSLSSVAVHEALALHPRPDATHVLVLGAGEAGRSAVEAMVDRGVGRVTVVNRTLARAETLANDLGGAARPIEDLVPALGEADIVVAATSAAQTVVPRAHLEAALRHRAERLADGPLLVFDIAMPRDFEPAARHLDGVVYRDLDDLQAISEANGAARGDEIDAVRALVNVEVDRFARWLSQLGVLPTVAAINERAEAMRAAQVERTLQALGGLGRTEEMRAQLDALTRSLVRQLLHDPITTLRRRGDRDDYVAAARTLFALDPTRAEESARPTTPPTLEA